MRHNANRHHGRHCLSNVLWCIVVLVDLPSKEDLLVCNMSIGAAMSVDALCDHAARSQVHTSAPQFVSKVNRPAAVDCGFVVQLVSINAIQISFTLALSLSRLKQPS
jgi:hypothetical protein